jgi:alanine racemase
MQISLANCSDHGHVSQCDLEVTPRRTIDLDAIEGNVRTIRRLAGADIMAVVKADGFGHGAVQVARAALRAGASWLGVATVEEGLALRRSGITAPILAWLVDPFCDLDEAVRLHVTLSCANFATLEAVLAVATAARIRAEVQLEIDTGMARGGCSPEDWAALCAAAAQAELEGTIQVSGVWSHLARADQPEWAAVSDAQGRFVDAIGTAWAAGLDPRHLHLANTAAALAHPRTRFTMVRVGAGLYGIETVSGQTFGLRAAETAVSRVSQVRDVPAGTPVSYGGYFVTGEATRLALVIGGYGDGIPRSLREVTIGGQIHPVVGAVTMDQFVVDVGAASVRVGDEVVLIGQEESDPTAADWARWAETNPHDILTGLGGRFTAQWRGRAARSTSAGALS